MTKRLWTGNRNLRNMYTLHMYICLTPVMTGEGQLCPKASAVVTRLISPGYYIRHSNSQQKPHTSPSRAKYGVFIMRNLKKNDRVITAPHCICKLMPWSVSIDQFHKSQNALVPYPILLHSEQKCAHFCSEWSIVGYGTGAFCDLWIRSILALLLFLFTLTDSVWTLRCKHDKRRFISSSLVCWNIALRVMEVYM